MNKKRKNKKCVCQGGWMCPSCQTKQDEVIANLEEGINNAKGLMNLMLLYLNQLSSID